MKPEDEPPTLTTEAEAEAETNTLDALLDEHQPRRDVPMISGPACLMGRVLDDRHPTLHARVQVRWQTAQGHTRERWLLTLQGLAVRTEDRVLMLCPEGSDEPVVTGVLDGFTRRPTPERNAAAQVELRRDEKVRIVGAKGEALLEIHEGESGPVVTILHDDLELAVPGQLRLRGKQVQLEATEGSVEVDASDEVTLRGEMIKLN